MICLINYFGGKGQLAPKLSKLVPYSHIYCEPYCGGASLFFYRERSPVEILNDLNKDVVNLFRVLQDPIKAEALKYRLSYTPYALEEFKKAIYEEPLDDVDWAWKTFIKLNCSIAGKILRPTPGNWSRSVTHSRRGMASAVSKFLSKIANLDNFIDRLKTVQIESKDAIEVMKFYDRPETVFYLDPPYILRNQKEEYYKVNKGESHHEQLVEYLLSDIKGAYVLSGYQNSLYVKLEENGWERTDINWKWQLPNKRYKTTKDTRRIEAVWRNPRCLELCN